MIQITTTQAKEYILGLLDDAMQNAYERDYTISIDDVDDLHDCTIETITDEWLYNQLNSQLPNVLDDCINYVEEAYDYEDPWREYYRNVFN